MLIRRMDSIPSEMTKRLRDLQGRPLRDLRISVTDRCNFRCVYCMPKQVFGADYQFLKREELLTFEEIVRLARIFVALGVEKIRLTGGEPLLRRQVESLIELLAKDLGIELTMTTNGSLLSQKAGALRKAGLKRISVSLDSLDHDVFAEMNGVGYTIERVLEGIEAAHAVGFMPIKINMVVKRGLNDGSILPMASRFRNSGHILRFIEYMDVGGTNGWRFDEVVTASEIVAILDSKYPLEAIEPNYHGEVARRYRYKDGGGEIGVIASVTQAFCADCTRARLSAKGSLYTCLFATRGTDLRQHLRNGRSDDDIKAIISSRWIQRNDRYSEIRSPETSHVSKVEMSYIGG